MNIDISKLVGVGVFFVMIFASGFWLSRMGKPYSAVLFNIHKLIALAALVFLIVIYTQVHKGTPLTLLEWVAVILTLICFVVTIISGGLLNLEKPLPGVLLILHRALPLLTLIGMAVSLYLMKPVGIASLP